MRHADDRFEASSIDGRGAPFLAALVTNRVCSAPFVAMLLTNRVCYANSRLATGSVARQPLRAQRVGPTRTEENRVVGTGVDPVTFRFSGGRSAN